jgi:hypothetical protein
VALRPFNPEATTKEELEASRTPEFFDIELRAFKGGASGSGTESGFGVKPLTTDERHLLSEYLKLHQDLGNTHSDGYDSNG